MGEDFLRRRNDRFVRRRDACLGTLLERDLFSMIPAAVTTTVYGSILHEVATNTPLWSPELEAGRSVRFYSGPVPTVEVCGPAAEALARTFGACGAELVAEVIETDSLEGIAMLHVRSVR